MELFDKIVDTFSKKINYVRKASMGVPKSFVINLALPLIDQPYHISGNLYYIWSAPKASYYVDVKVNKSSEPALRCVSQTGLLTPFDKLLITTPEDQEGDMVILYGTEAPELLSILDNRAAVIAGVGDLLTLQTDILGRLTEILAIETSMLGELQVSILGELRGDIDPGSFIGIAITAAPGATEIVVANATRKGCGIQALSTNTGNVFIGFANTVTVGGAPGIWFKELQPGMSFDITNYRGPFYGIATAAQVVGIGEW